ncbi:hypothetical protein [Rhodovulum steppense]|nr:hypothetical protein [Rhodovulum steppense]
MAPSVARVSVPNRDIAALLAFGLLRKGEGGGRSTHYKLVL